MKMSSHPKKDLTPIDIVEFLKPLIDILKCDMISLTNLMKNRKEIISKLKVIGRPVLLRIDNQTLLLCDAKTYSDVETRRMGIISQFKSVEDALQVGKVDFADPRFIELDAAQREVVELEDATKSSKWDLEQAKEKLKRLKGKLPEAKRRLAKLAANLPAN